MATDLLSLRLAFRALSDEPDGEDDVDALADDAELDDDMDDADDEEETSDDAGVTAGDDDGEVME